MPLTGVKGIPGKVGLGEAGKLLKYGAPMVGELVMWSRSEMPQEIWPDCGMEFIPYLGQSFDAGKYPLLAQLHPSLVLPADMRGYVPRGCDSGRGIDTDRVLMSAQEDAIRNITGSEFRVTRVSSAATTPTGAFSDATLDNATTISGSGTPMYKVNFDASNSPGVLTANENRMKNVAWNFIVRAK